MTIRKKNLTCRHCGAPLPPGRLESCAPPKPCGKILEREGMERRDLEDSTQKERRGKAAREKAAASKISDRKLMKRRQEIIDAAIAKGYRIGE